MPVSHPIARVLVPGAILLLGFALRLYRLDEQSLRNDEILSMYAIQAGLSDMFGQVALLDHPPLYFLFLWSWRQLAGESEFAVRFISLGLGLLTLGLLYGLGRHLAGDRVGLMAALLGAVSPFLVLYSQEARMYALATVFGVLALLLLLLALGQGGFRYWLGWALAALAAFFSDYTSLLVLLPVELFLVGLLLRRLRQLWRPWLWSQALLVVPVLLWVLLLGIVGKVYQGAAGASSWSEVVGEAVRALAVGESLGGAPAWAGAAFIFGLAVGGMAFPRSAPGPRLLLGGIVVGAIALVTLLSSQGLGFAPRHVLIATPALLLLASLGLAALALNSRWLLVPLVPVLVASGLSLSNYYTDPWYGREDFRAVGRYLDDQVRAGDVVVFDAPWTTTPLRYYSRLRFPSAGVPQRVPLEPELAEADLRRLVQDYRRIWLVQWQDWIADPQGFVRSWLGQHTFPVGTRSFPYITVSTYLARPPLSREKPPIQHPLNAELGKSIRFLGYDLDTQDLERKGRLYLTLYWQGLAPVKESYAVFTHVVNGALRIWGQKDNRPVYDRVPTDRWEPGTYFRDEYQIDLLPGTPPGVYQIAVGMYHPATWETLKIGEGGQDRLLLGPVHLARPVPLAQVPQPLEVSFGSRVRLLGYDLAPASRPGGAKPSIQPGDRLHLSLFWRAQAPLNGDYQVALRLRSPAGKVVWSQSAAPADGTYPTTSWQPEAGPIRDQHDLQIPASAAPGPYLLEVALQETATQAPLPTERSASGWVTLRQIILEP